MNPGKAEKPQLSLTICEVRTTRSANGISAMDSCLANSDVILTGLWRISAESHTKEWKDIFGKYRSVLLLVYINLINIITSHARSCVYHLDGAQWTTHIYAFCTYDWIRRNSTLCEMHRLSHHYCVSWSCSWKQSTLYVNFPSKTAWEKHIKTGQS